MTTTAARGIHAHDELKLGKKKRGTDGKDFKFAALIDKTVTVRVPSSVAYQDKVSTFPMLGNADWGDCVFAGKYHQIQVWDAVVGERTFTPTDQEALRDYSRVTGFDPSNPSSDQGTVPRDALNDWRKVAAADGQRLEAFAAVNFKVQHHVKLATWLGGGVGVGVQLPLSAQKQVKPNGTFRPTTGKNAASGSWGGHWVPGTGFTRSGLVVITWGMEMLMTWAFLERYCDEMWFLQGPEWFDKSGIDPTGLNRIKLQSMIQGL